MTDENTDTPYAASLRPPGESVRPAVPPPATDQDIAADAAPAGDDPTGEVERGAGYDVNAVSGDTEAYRPD